MKLLTSALIAAALLTSTVSLPVLAATTAPATQAATANISAVASQLAALKTSEERIAAFTPLLTATPAAAVPLMKQVKANCVASTPDEAKTPEAACTPAKASIILQEILAFLSQNKVANQAIIDQLLADNADLVALIGGDIEPAEGPGGDNPDFGSNAGNNDVLENPNQISRNTAQ